MASCIVIRRIEVGLKPGEPMVEEGGGKGEQEPSPYVIFDQP